VTATSLAAAPPRTRVEGPLPWYGRLRVTPVGLVAAMVCTAIVILPVLVPPGPANTGPVDVLILAALAVLALDSLAYRTQLHLPYTVPVVLLVLAGGAAGLHRDRVLTSGLALLQDLVLLLWSATVASLGRDPVLLRQFLRLWVGAAATWAVVLVVAVNVGLDSVAGITADEGGRASLTFGDPNRAGCYFATSFLLLRAAGWPARRPVRWCCGAAMLLALAYTGSNAAIVGLLVGVMFGAAVHFWRRHGWVPLIGVTCLVAAPLAIVLASLDVSVLQQRASHGGRILANSVARSDKGASDRALLVTENLALYRAHDVVGAGPGGTKALLAAEQAPFVKEAHNDYLAALLERGVLGAVGVVVLWAAVGGRCLRLCARSPDPRLLAVMPRPELLAGAVLGAMTFGWFHEALHFRHVWALLGLVAAASLMTDGAASDEGGAR
jgi:O-antigen ligase